MREMYKARHIKRTKHRVTLPMLVLIAALCVAILVFPTTASGADTTPDAISGARNARSSSSSAGTYSIVPSAQHGGSVTPSSSDAISGNTVTFDVKPDSGFETSSVSVITSNGNTLEVLRVKGETYKFVMPAEGVIIDVAFQYIKSA